MNHEDDMARREVTRKRPRSGAYSRTVINLTADEERKLKAIAISLGMDTVGEARPSKAMVIAELIDKAARHGLDRR